MNAKQILFGLAAVSLVAGLAVLPACGDTNTGGDNNDNNNVTNNGTNNGNNGNNSNNGTNNGNNGNNGNNSNNGTNNADPCDACTADQECVNDVCVDPVVCEGLGDACDSDTNSTDEFICFNGDNTNPNEATCHGTCEDTDASTDCPQGSFCVGLVDQQQNPVGNVCIPSNCGGYFQSDDCAGASANGGTCAESANGAFYCQEAGTLAAGEPCADQAECGSDLFCFFGACQPLCTLNNADHVCPEGLGCIDLLDSNTVGVCGDDCTGFGYTPESGECAEGMGCLPITTDSGVCVEVGAGEVRSACDDASEAAQCGALSTCVSLAEAYDPTCQPLCDLGAADPEASCGEGEVCIVAFQLSDTTGVCVPGCDPSTPENECTTEGGQTCLPVEPTRGICIDSGSKAPGGVCNLIDESIFGDCGSNSACLPDSFDDTSPTAPGTCQEVCLTFSSVNDYESGCPDNEICEIFGADWGLCTDATINPALGSFEPCTRPGEWCSNDNICLEIDAQGNALCIPLCRFDGNDCDGIELQGSPTACDVLFDSDTLGACIPQ